MWKFLSGGAALSRPPANLANPKRTADRTTDPTIVVHPITPPSTPSSTLNEKVAVEIIADSTIASIPKTAARMTELLIDALDDIRDLYPKAPTSEALKTHEREIKSTRKLVQKIQHQEGLHTARVAEALGTLRAVVERLSTSTHSLQLVNNMIGEVSSARTNLLDSLPANMYEAADNKVEDGIQFNAEFGGNSVEGRVIMTACGNEAKNGFQVNAPVRGDPEAFLKLAALYKRA